MQPVWVERTDENGVLVLRICGELDMVTCKPIESAITAAIETVPAVVLDLSELTFCDSSGLAMFVMARENAAERSVAWSMRNPRASVRRVFEIVGLGDMFDANA